MPLHVSIPLGPLHYTRRLGGRHHGQGGRGLLFWLALGWWLYPCVWILAGTWWLAKLTVLGAVALVRLARGQAAGGSTGSSA